MFGRLPPQHSMKSYKMRLPRLYPILDSSCFSDLATMLTVAEELSTAGISVLQYRNKSDSAGLMLNHAGEFRSRLGTKIKLIMNDRADLCLAADFDGLHVGQNDLSPESARRIIGNERWLGVSTHNPEQVTEADNTLADYLAIGPIFATKSKLDSDPVVGLDGLRRARELTRKPLVAIGGITRANAMAVIDAGADSVAVISDLLLEPRKSAEQFLRLLG